jgi:hypothetical protein
MADVLRAMLKGDGWRLVNESVFPLVCFTHDAIADQHLTTQQVVDRVLARKRCWISHVTLARNTHALRACITSFDTNQTDLDVLLEDLAEAIAR